MCPLRLILIFLSATLAGFFVIRNLKSRPLTDNDDDGGGGSHDLNNSPQSSDSSSSSIHSRFFKVRSVMESGFWTCVDMASGRYLWRHLVSSTSSASSSKRSS